MKLKNQLNLKLRNKEICVFNFKFRSSLYLDYLNREERLLRVIKTCQISR